MITILKIIIILFALIGVSVMLALLIELLTGSNHRNRTRYPSIIGIGLVSVLLTGCVSDYYADQRVIVKRTAFGTDTKATKLQITCTANSTTIKAGAVESDNADTVSKTSGAVVEGIIKGIK